MKYGVDPVLEAEADRILRESYPKRRGRYSHYILFPENLYDRQRREVYLGDLVDFSDGEQLTAMLPLWNDATTVVKTKLAIEAARFDNRTRKKKRE